MDAFQLFINACDCSEDWQVTDTLKTRIRKAWQALRGTLEPEVREVEKVVKREVIVRGEAVPVDLYEAVSKRRARMRVYPCAIPLPDGDHENDGKIYASCAEAFAAIPDGDVDRRKAYRIGSRYFVGNALTEIKVERKPRKAKGK